MDRSDKPLGSERQIRRPSGWVARGTLVEAAGQRFHLFRDGLDYAFIRSSVTREPERGVLSGSSIDPNPSTDSSQPSDQSAYESLQGKESWPLRTPRRCHVTHRRVTQGSPIEPRFHFALAGKGDHCVNRTRVRKSSAISSTCVVASIVLTGSNPTNRAR